MVPILAYRIQEREFGGLSHGARRQLVVNVPVWGTSALATGDYLGWYFTDGGSIAFNLTGGQGGTYAPFPQPSLGPNDVTTTPVTDRDYAVGFVTSELAPVPEPNYAPILALCLGTLLFFRSRFLSDRQQKC